MDTYTLTECFCPIIVPMTMLLTGPTSWQLLEKKHWAVEALNAGARIQFSVELERQVILQVLHEGLAGL